MKLNTCYSITWTDIKFTDYCVANASLIANKKSTTDCNVWIKVEKIDPLSYGYKKVKISIYKDMELTTLVSQGNIKNPPYDTQFVVHVHNKKGHICHGTVTIQPPT